MIRTVEKILAPLKRRVRLMVSRAIIKAIDDSKGLQQMQVDALADETLDRVERFQGYGFTSVPLPGGSALVVCVGGSRSHPVIVATDDARYRLTGLQPGEVALYTDQGDKIHIKRGGNIDIVAATKLKITAPAIEMTGPLTVAGNITVTGGNVVADGIGLKTHVHPGVTAGSASTGLPT